MNQRLKSALVHSGLFVITFMTTTIAGSWWAGGAYFMHPWFVINLAYTWSDFKTGLPYSITFLLILTVHEFGHYFTAMYHRVKATLPYYIPLPPYEMFLGTLGALIRIKSIIHSKKENFDIGIAGPLAGFIIAIAALFYGFMTLPEPGYIFQVHPEYQKFGENYADVVYAKDFLGNNADIVIGNNLLFWFFEKFIADPARVPNHHEIIHFPVIFAAFLSLVFTSLNLLPIGQLDGGHVLYGLVGRRRHRIIASVIFVLFLGYATLGMMTPFEPMNVFGLYPVPHYAGILVMIALMLFCLRGLALSTLQTTSIAVGMVAVEYALQLIFPGIEGYSGWLLFALIIGRLMPVAHPPTQIEEPLSSGRQILGWIALIIFVICWTPRPIDVVI
jgi:membrane-associated protease RseP (regulator of RpoE activity)